MGKNPLYIIILIINIIYAYIAYRVVKYIKNKYWPDLVLKADSPIDQAFSKKQKLLIIGIPLFIAAFFVILYKNLSEQKFIDFVEYGFASVVPNFIFIFILFYIYKDKFLKELGGNYSVAIVYILTLVIPFFIYFVLISLLFSGWQIPFNY